MVKKVLLFGIFCLVCVSGFAQLRTKVDERFELTSLIFRMAGAEEYVNDGMSAYVEDVDKYFSKYADHPLIPYVQRIREEHFVSYDAVATSTSLLLIEKNKIILNPRVDLERYLSKELRWNKETLTEYIRLLNDFYKKTKFNTFFSDHADSYKKAEQALDEILSTVDTGFFEDFYERPFGNPSVYLSMLNGPSNYALISYTDDPGDFGIVIGAGFSGPDGVPFFYPAGILHTIIHEFSHNFANPLVDIYFDEMLPAAEEIFPHVQERLAQYAYGQPLSILYEGFTNLFTHLYFKEKSTEPELGFISDSERRGFVWMGDAVTFVDNFFYPNRDIYPTIAEFMPQLAGFINIISNSMERVMIDYRSKTPRVIGIYPALENMSLDTKEIRVLFSKPMAGSHGLRQIEEENVTFPECDMPYWDADGYTFVIPVKSLERNKQYGFSLRWDFFASQDRLYTLLKDFEIRFTIAEE